MAAHTPPGPPSAPDTPPQTLARHGRRSRAVRPEVAAWRNDRDARHAHRSEMEARAAQLEQKAQDLRAQAEADGRSGVASVEALIALPEVQAREIRHSLALAGPVVTPKCERPVCGARTRGGEPCQARAAWDNERDEPRVRSARCRMHGGNVTKETRAKCRAAAARAYEIRTEPDAKQPPDWVVEEMRSFITWLRRMVDDDVLPSLTLRHRSLIDFFERSVAACERGDWPVGVPRRPLPASRFAST